MKKFNYNNIASKIQELEKVINKTDDNILIIMTHENNKIQLDWTNRKGIHTKKEFDTLEDAEKQINALKCPHVIDINVLED
jgi:hypothetical protein